MKTGDKVEDYIIDKDGNRAMSPEYIHKQEIEYLKAKGLYSLSSTEAERRKYADILRRTIPWWKPAIIVYKKDISKDIYATLVALIRRNVKTFLNFDITSVTHLCQQYLSGEYHDISDEFDYAKILFVNMNMSDTPHMYNAFCARNIAIERYNKNKLTYLFFQGTMEDLLSSQWSIDEEGVGNKGVNWDAEKHELVDLRRLSNLSKYIKVIDLNERLKK